MTTPVLAMAQQTPKTAINEFLENWAWPIFGLFVVAGVLHGLISNAGLIQDKNEQGTTLKGFINSGKILLYYLLAVGVIIGVLAAINGLSGSVRLD